VADSEIKPIFEELLESIYEGPFEDAPWRSFLEVIQRSLEAETAGIILWRPGGDRGVVLAETVGREWIAMSGDAFFETYLALDPFVDLPPGRPITFDELVPDEAELLASELHAQYMRPMGIRYALGVDVKGPTGLELRLRAARSPTSRDFSDDEKSACARLVPHLERSLEIFAKIRRMEARRALYEGVMDQIATGMMLLDEGGNVLQMNRAAQKIIDDGGLSIIDGKLHIEDEDAAVELRRLIHEAGASEERRKPSVMAALRVQNGAGAPSLSLLVRPLPAGAGGDAGSPIATVFLSRPEERHSIPPEIIQQLFGLTKTESSVTSLLAQGIGVEEIASRLGVSVYTVRTHIRSVFKKTGVSKQTELIRRVLKSLPG
jgi:DNA-binding CsgD family transcriptional regulator/PAS domain-containing protein